MCVLGHNMKGVFFTVSYVREVSEMLLEKIVSLYSGFFGSISSFGVLKSRWDWER